MAIEITKDMFKTAKEKNLKRQIGNVYRDEGDDNWSIEAINPFENNNERASCLDEDGEENEEEFKYLSISLTPSSADELIENLEKMIAFIKFHKDTCRFVSNTDG